MDATEFKAELSTEYNDVQLTDYLTTLLRQLEAFSDVCAAARRIAFPS